MGGLVRKVIDGDRESFKVWMDNNIRTIERFAIQYGTALHDAANVAETVFRNLYNDLGHLTEGQLEEKSLFKTALQELNGLDVEVPETGLFPFEEDNELHARLLDLPKEERVVFILSHLHDKPNIEISWIMEKTLAQVNDLLQDALAKLDGHNMEKQLEFLNKSFHRLRPAYDERNIFISKPTEVVQNGEPLKKVSRQKRPLYLWLIGSAVLILLLSLTVLRSSAYQQSAAEKFIEELKVTFQQELDDRFELVGLLEKEEGGRSSYTVMTHGLEYRVTEVTYGIETKYKFNRLIRELEDQVRQEGSVNKKEAKKLYDELVHELRLPSEMVDNLQINPLTSDREQSLVFLDEFARKQSYFASAYLEILAEHADLILSSEFYNDGIVDVELLLYQSSLPSDLQKAIDGMSTQYFALESIKDFTPLETNYGGPELEEKLKKNLHPDMQIYISLLTKAYRNIYIATFDELLEALLELEKELPNTRESDQLTYLFNSTYLWTFLTAAGFNHEAGIYNTSGVVRDEVRDKWSRLASSNSENSPSSQVMQQIIEEMEASNWTTSQYYEELMINGVWTGLGSKIKKVRTAGKE